MLRRSRNHPDTVQRTMSGQMFMDAFIVSVNEGCDRDAVPHLKRHLCAASSLRSSDQRYGLNSVRVWRWRRVRLKPSVYSLGSVIVSSGVFETQIKTSKHTSLAGAAACTFNASTTVARRLATRHWTRDHLGRHGQVKNMTEATVTTNEREKGYELHKDSVLQTVYMKKPHKCKPHKSNKSNTARSSGCVVQLRFWFACGYYIVEKGPECEQVNDVRGKTSAVGIPDHPAAGHPVVNLTSEAVTSSAEGAEPFHTAAETVAGVPSEAAG